MSAFHQPPMKESGGQLFLPPLIVQQNTVYPASQVLSAPHTASYALAGRVR